MSSKAKTKRKGNLPYLADPVPYRINSVKNLGTIAVALGPDRTRNELLPYILGTTAPLTNALQILWTMRKKYSLL